MKFESFNNGEAVEMEAYRRLVRGMSDVDLVKALDDLQETLVALGHHVLFLIQ